MRNIAKSLGAVLLSAALCLGACGASLAATTDSDAGQSGSTPITAADLPEGTYGITVATDNDAIAVKNCQLTIKDKKMTAVITLDGSDYKYLCTDFDSEKSDCKVDAAECTLNKKGLCTFPVGVTTLNEPVNLAVYDEKADTWAQFNAIFEADDLYGDVIMAGDFATETDDPYICAATVELEDGTYEMDVALAGGSGRASISSPCTVTVKDGRAMARIEWSSNYYEYMVVNGYKYMPVETEENSIFEIPVTTFEFPMACKAETSAMSEPHEIDYALSFDLDSAKSVGGSGLGATAIVIIVIVIVIIIAAIAAVMMRKRKGAN